MNVISFVTIDPPTPLAAQSQFVVGTLLILPSLSWDQCVGVVRARSVPFVLWTLTGWCSTGAAGRDLLVPWTRWRSVRGVDKMVLCWCFGRDDALLALWTGRSPVRVVGGMMLCWVVDRTKFCWCYARDDALLVL